MIAIALLALLIAVPLRAELRDTTNAVDYLILTSEEIYEDNAWIDSLLDYRTAQGRVSMVVTVEDVYEEFEQQNEYISIRDFLQYAYHNWEEPRLKDVFIIGHVNAVPTRMYLGYYPDEVYFSDFYLACPDPESEGSPLFRVGRLPWLSDGPIPDFFGKVRQYESNTSTPCSETVQVIAGPDLISDGIDLEAIAESIVVRLPDVNLELDFTGRSPEDPAYGDPEEIFEHLSAGPFAVFVSDLCSSEGWGYAEVSREIVNSLENGPCYSIYSGLTGGDYGRENMPNLSVAGNAVLNPNGAAIAVLGATGYPWYYQARNFEYGVAGALLNESNSTIGDIWYGSVASYVETHDISRWGIWFEILFSNVLIGDPATLIPGRTTSVDPIAAPVVPSEIRIVGNYPNPFNPSTTISFLLNRAGNARLTVYDISGRAVTTLAERSFTAGQHSIVWNAKGQASGTYLVRLESAGQFTTHRVTLLK